MLTRTWCGARRRRSWGGTSLALRWPWLCDDSVVLNRVYRRRRHRRGAGDQLTGIINLPVLFIASNQSVHHIYLVV